MVDKLRNDSVTAAVDFIISSIVTPFEVGGTVTGPE